MNTTLLNVIQPGDLANLPAQIDAAIEDVRNHANGMVHAAVRAGQLLIEAKAALPHGEFEAWITSNCTVAPRTAQAYMRLATKLKTLPPAEAQRVADLPLREALKAIGTTAEAPPPNYRIEVRGKDDRERIVTAMQKGADAVRKAARLVSTNSAKRQDIDQARAKLQAAIEMLDKFASQAEVQS